ncbi:MAG: hypothetical protein AAGA70_07105 [Pseudomonadota bacterium]
MIRQWQYAEDGVMPTDRGHDVAWSVWGNPEASTSLLLHAGPGGGISDGLRAIFDPEAWRIVAMDQQGAGRSLPHAGRDLAAREAHRTEDLVADAERLRRRLGIEAWAVFEGS